MLTLQVSLSSESLSDDDSGRVRFSKQIEDA